MQELAARGLGRAKLDVDAANATDALRVYRKAGMTDRPAFTIWSAPLQAALRSRGNRTPHAGVGREVTRSVASATETDAALIASARAGDVASYGLLVARYQSLAHRTAYLLGAGDDTPDVVQEAFVKAYLALHRFRVEEPFRPWLLTIVANESRNRWRRASRRRTVPLALLGDDEATSTAPSPEQVAEDAETSLELRDAVAALPVRQREVVVCRYLLDMAEHDTSQVLGIPPGTVKSRLARGLRALQAALTEPAPAPVGERGGRDG